MSHGDNGRAHGPRPAHRAPRRFGLLRHRPVTLAVLAAAAALVLLTSGLTHPQKASAVTTTAAPTAGVSVTPSDTNGDGVVGDYGDNLHWSYSVGNSGQGGAGYAACSIVTQNFGTITFGAGGTYSFTNSSGQGVSALPAGSTNYFGADMTIVWGAGTVVSDTMHTSCKASGGSFLASGNAATSWTVQSSPSRSLNHWIVASAADSNADGVAGGPGDTVTFTYYVQNTGSQTLQGINVYSNLFGGVYLGPGGAIAPGQTTAVARSLTVTQAQANAGSISDTTQATSQTVTPDNVTILSNVTGASVGTGQPPIRGISMTGTASCPDSNLDGRVCDPGDKITYSYAVTNNGNQALGTVTISTGQAGTLAGPGQIGAGAVQTITGTHTITAADVASGTVTSSAQASTRSITGDNVPISSTTVSLSTTGLTAAPVRSLALTSSSSVADTNSDGRIGDAGDKITVTYTVKNTGDSDQPLAAVTIASSLNGSVSIGSLGGGATSTSTQVHTVTAAEMAAGHATDAATASGQTTTGDNITVSSASAALQVATVAAPVRKLTTTVQIAYTDDGGDGVAGDHGDKAHVTITVANAGDDNLGPITIDSALIGHHVSDDPVDAGTSTTVTGVYAITAADVAAAKLVDTITASAVTTTPDTVTVHAPDKAVSQPLLAAPVRSLSITTTLVDDDTNGDGVAAANGDQVVYSYTVKNTGEQDLAGITIASSVNGAIPVTASLNPGESKTVTSSYLLSAADAAAGTLTDAAAAAAYTTTPDDVQITSSTASKTITVHIAPIMTIAPTSASAPLFADSNGDRVVGDGGDYVTLSWAVENTGEVDVQDCRISDSLGAWAASWDGTAIAMGDTARVTTTWQVDYREPAAALVDQATVSCATVTPTPITITATATVAVAEQAPPAQDPTWQVKHSAWALLRAASSW